MVKDRGGKLQLNTGKIFLTELFNHGIRCLGKVMSPSVLRLFKLSQDLTNDQETSQQTWIETWEK